MIRPPDYITGYVGAGMALQPLINEEANSLLLVVSQFMASHAISRGRIVKPWD
jgi:hypothetical protein